MPPPRVNTYSVFQSGADVGPAVLVPSRDGAKNILAALDNSSATGPDKLPTRFLKACADQLALPVLLLSRKLISSGTWPECWRVHWIVPLHKKGSVADPRNYRGIHFSSQLSNFPK